MPPKLFAKATMAAKVGTCDDDVIDDDDHDIDGTSENDYDNFAKATMAAKVGTCDETDSEDDDVPDICHRHQWQCLCKIFLLGVKFSRLNAKICTFYSIWGIFGCKIWNLKILSM